MCGTTVDKYYVLWGCMVPDIAYCHDPTPACQYMPHRTLIIPEKFCRGCANGYAPMMNREMEVGTESDLEVSHLYVQMKQAEEDYWRQRLASANNNEDALIVEETMLSDSNFLKIQRKADVTQETERAILRLFFLFERLTFQISTLDSANIFPQLLERKERLIEGLVTLNEKTVINLFRIYQRETILRMRRAFIAAHPIEDTELASEFHRTTQQIEEDLMLDLHIPDDYSDFPVHCRPEARMEIVLQNRREFISACPIDDPVLALRFEEETQQIEARLEKYQREKLERWQVFRREREETKQKQ